jgi:hypothetical protein
LTASREPLGAGKIPAPFFCRDPTAVQFVTLNTLSLVNVPLGVVTETDPLVAPVGMIAFISVSDVMVKPAEVPLKETSLAPVNP